MMLNFFFFFFTVTMFHFHIGVIKPFLLSLDIKCISEFFLSLEALRRSQLVITRQSSKIFLKQKEYRGDTWQMIKQNNFGI